uniref:Uncharacterized protein n=1 Tax=Glossina austeni TaxID=7395 RepID=A0A1A9V0V9_GLOAU
MSALYNKLYLQLLTKSTLFRSCNHCRITPNLKFDPLTISRYSSRYVCKFPDLTTLLRLIIKLNRLHMVYSPCKTNFRNAYAVNKVPLIAAKYLAMVFWPLSLLAAPFIALINLRPVMLKDDMPLLPEGEINLLYKDTQQGLIASLSPTIKVEYEFNSRVQHFRDQALRSFN